MKIFARKLSLALVFGLLHLLVCGSIPAHAQEAAGTPAAKGPTSLEKYLKMLGYVSVNLTSDSYDEAFILKTRVNGKKHLLLLDTGCPFTTLDPNRVKNLKTLGELKTTLQDSYLGKLDMPSILLIDDLSIGAYRFVNQPAQASVLDMDYIRIVYDGLLGLDFIVRNYGLIDCANQKLYLRGSKPPERVSEALARSLAGSGYIPVPLDRSGYIYVNARVGAQSIRWIVDTGAEYTMITESTCNRLGLRVVQTQHGASLLPQDLEGQIIGLNQIGSGDHSLKVTHLPALSIGTRTLGGVNVGVTDYQFTRTGPDHPVDDTISGVLGDELLASSGALIDLSSNTLWLAPASHSAAN